MAKQSLRQIKGKLNAREQAHSRKLVKAVSKNEMCRLGTDPVLTRNLKMEKTWKALLQDPPVAHSDINQWRTAADVRPSSFPFCPRKYTMERLGLVMPSDFVVESNFYTEIGKAVHYVAQNALAQTGRLWGFWLCARPTCEHRIQRQFYSTTPGFFPKGKRCPNCKSKRFEYEELVVQDPKIGLRGHVDGIIVYKGFSSVLEIKTAGDEKVEQMLAKSDAEVSKAFMSESPWYGYWHQASSYAALLRMKYPSLPPIKYVDYLIFSRDKPKGVVSYRLEVPMDNSWWFEIRSRIIMAQAAKAAEILPQGFAKSQSDIEALPTCKWCSHKEVCLKPEGKLGYQADALYDKQAEQDLLVVLNKEKRQWAESSVET